MLTAKTHSFIEHSRHWNVDSYLWEIDVVGKFKPYFRYFHQNCCSFEPYSNAVLIVRNIRRCGIIDFDLDAIKRMVCAEKYSAIPKMQPALRC